MPSAATTATNGENRIAKNGFQPRLWTRTPEVQPPTANSATWAKE